MSSNTCQDGAPSLNTTYGSWGYFSHYGALSITIRCGFCARGGVFPLLVRVSLCLAKLPLFQLFSLLGPQEYKPFFSSVELFALLFSQDKVPEIFTLLFVYGISSLYIYKLSLLSFPHHTQLDKVLPCLTQCLPNGFSSEGQRGLLFYL